MNIYDVLHYPSKHEIETFSGRYVDLSDPSPASIVLEDVAHGLAHTCRYNGQIDYYSVAEHAVAVSVYLERMGYSEKVCLMGLHHDDAEAYLGDVTRPLKSLLQPAYGRLTEAMDAAIIEGLDLPWDTEQGNVCEKVIKDADNWALMREARALLPSQGKTWGGLGDGSTDTEFDAARLVADLDNFWSPECLSPVEAEGAWLSRHWALV